MSGNKSVNIPDEVVDALADIIDAAERKGLPPAEPSWAHYIARAALEAATPQMLAAAWDAALEVAAKAAWEHDAGASSAISELPNPYRSQA